MFLGRKNQFCESDYTTKAIYRFNVIPDKAPMTVLTELEQKFHNLETRKTPNSQSSLEKEERSLRNQPHSLLQQKQLNI